MLKNKLQDKRFNIVSCQFAIHYFFEKKESLSNFLDIVSYFLRENGVFILTTMNGDAIKEELKRKKGIIKNDIFRIKQLVLNDSCYGNKYSVSLGAMEGEDHYFSQKESNEYMVHKSELIKECKKRGIEYKTLTLFSEWNKEYKTRKPEYNMDDNEKEFSFYNFSMLFTKSKI